MPASFATNPLNYILRSESWACKRLQPHEGKIVCIRIPPIAHFKMIVLANGEMQSNMDNLEADTTLSILPAILPGLIMHDESAYDGISISGDALFAEDLITVSKYLKPNFEQALSKILGDIPAHRITKAKDSFCQWHIHLVKNLSDALGEYWQEERPIIAKSNAIKDFSRQLNELKHDVNQLEHRINQIFLKDTLNNR
ncbi:ubiquinone biosynthesis protein UbiJ [Nitrosomonas aestuarii]|uniref:Ubiquinone biosynthesis accessory factor UbiJ n=1 Tax=Nitrosomonas aestuarii TaxID=52441 RepID=A0A1I4EV51_9PROT|nr:hypothetical protein [Nitrosomonas aestuarii]SFL08416.1 ubiquinone biosynthesis protein UbiJ [Nitrosomonas aestuarii]